MLDVILKKASSDPEKKPLQGQRQLATTFFGGEGREGGEREGRGSIELTIPNDD